MTNEELKNQRIFRVQCFVNGRWCKGHVSWKWETAMSVLRCSMAVSPERQHRIKFKVFADIG